MISTREDERGVIARIIGGYKMERDLTSMKMPTWWTDSYQEAWENRASGRPGPPVSAGRLVNDMDQAPAGSWRSLEPAVRYGFGARQHYPSYAAGWNEEVERTLRAEWKLVNSGSSWELIKDAVRRGWEA